MASRRSVLARTGAALLSPAAGASAFDLPPRDGFAGAVSPYTLDDPMACRKYAAMANPDKLKQQASAFFAVSSGDIGSLQAMADNGWALAEIVDESGTTLLHRSAKVGDDSAVKLLIKAGSSIDAYTTFMETPLHLAVRNNRLACVKALVEAGASTAAVYGKSGDTAVTLAKKYKFESIVDYFKSKGVASAEPLGGEITQGRECYIVGLFCK